MKHMAKHTLQPADKLRQMPGGTVHATAYPDTIYIEVWSCVHMAILADAILGVLLDGFTISRQMRLQWQSSFGP